MLKPGEQAADFTLRDKNGAPVSLSDFRGQKVVLYFYPKDDTPGCTKQACTFRDSYLGFVDANVKVIGISRDSTASHRAFSERYHLPFTLLADSDGAVGAAYGVKRLFFVTRTTFIVDENGIIEMVFPNADPGRNAADILTYLGV